MYQLCHSFSGASRVAHHRATTTNYARHASIECVCVYTYLCGTERTSGAITRRGSEKKLGWKGHVPRRSKSSAFHLLASRNLAPSIDFPQWRCARRSTRSPAILPTQRFRDVPLARFCAADSSRWTSFTHARSASSRYKNAISPAGNNQKTKCANMPADLRRNW